MLVRILLIWAATSISFFFCSLSYAFSGEPMVMGYLTDSSIGFIEKPVNVISPTWYALTRKKGVVGASNPHQIQAAQERGIRVVPLIQSFNARTLHQHIKSQINREKLVLQMVPLLLTPGVDGLQIDFENLYPSDRENFNQFLSLLYDVVASLDKTLMIALPARTSTDQQYQGFDFEFIGAHVHYAILMTYDENVRRPGPIASLEWVRETLEYAQSLIPREKILLGIPFYGRYWQTGRQGRGLSQAKVEKFYSLYGQHKPKVTDGGAYFRTEQGVVWYEAEEHLKAKVELLLKEKLAGMAVWRLGYEKKTFWPVIMETLYAPTVEQPPPTPLENKISLATFLFNDHYPRRVVQ